MMTQIDNPMPIPAVIPLRVPFAIDFSAIARLS